MVCPVVAHSPLITKDLRGQAKFLGAGPRNSDATTRRRSLPPRLEESKQLPTHEEVIRMMYPIPRRLASPLVSSRPFVQSMTWILFVRTVPRYVTFSLEHSVRVFALPAWCCAVLGSPLLCSASWPRAIIQHRRKNVTRNVKSLSLSLFCP